MALNRFFNKIHRFDLNRLLCRGVKLEQPQLCCYSSMMDKCKKVKSKKVDNKCPSFKFPNCPERTKYETVCKKQPEVVDCKKQEAPYPAYSDLCHTEVEEKPSECRLCPWRIDPNYLPPKRRYHTSTHLSMAADNKTPDCPKAPTDFDRSEYDNPKPCHPKPENTKVCPNDLLETKKRKKPPRPEKPQ